MQKFITCAALAAFVSFGAQTLNAETFSQKEKANLRYPSGIFDGVHNEENATGIYHPFNLIKNPGFETQLEMYNENNGKPAEWLSSTPFGEFNVRSNKQSLGEGKEGEFTFLWRDDNNDKKATHLYQPVKLYPNTDYRIQFSAIIHQPQNSTRDYYVGVGSSPGGMEYCKEIFTIPANGILGDYEVVSFDFRTPADLGEDHYFTICNTELGDLGTNKWRIFQLDKMTLVAGFGAHYGIDASLASALEQGDLSEVQELTVTGTLNSSVLSALESALKGNFSLTKVDLTGAVVPEDAEDIFNKINPYCLKYLAQDAVIPEGWTNVIVKEPIVSKFPSNVFDGVDDAVAKTGIYSSYNILKNPGFETVSIYETDANALPGDWQASVPFDRWGVRANKDLVSEGKEGQYTFLWRDDSWEMSGQYLYQPIKVHPNTSYKIEFNFFMHEPQPKNTPRLYYVGVGSTENGMEYGQSSFTAPANVARGEYRTVSYTFTTPDVVAPDSYFTIANQTFVSGDGSNNSYRIIHLDRMTMVKELGAQYSYVLDASEIAQLAEGDLADVSELIITGNLQQADMPLLKLALTGNRSLIKVDMEGAEVAENAIDIFNEINPNALKYFAEETIVPAGWSNVVKGEHSENITLKDGYIFHNTTEFTAEAISYERNCDFTGWATFCVPFPIQDLEGLETIEEFKEFTDNKVYFETATEVVANTAYLIKIATEGVKTFSATNVVVPVTETETGVFNATFSQLPVEKSIGKFILVNENGKDVFARASIKAVVPAFRGYLDIPYSVANPNGAKQFSVVHDEDDITVIEGNTDINSGMTLYAVDGKLVICLDEMQNIQIYSIDGRIVKSISLNEGENTIDDLVKGIYIVRNQKVVIN